MYEKSQQEIDTFWITGNAGRQVIKGQAINQISYTEALKRLSRRQRQVLRLLERGLTSGEIALELGLSIRTVENHRYNIGLELDLRGPGTLCRWLEECIRERSDGAGENRNNRN